MTVAERVTHFWNRVKRADGCWEWQGARLPKGYGQVHIGRTPDGNAINWSSHRVAYTLTHGPIPAGMTVRHSCDNPPCCNPDHLLLGTQGDNVNDANVQGHYNVEHPGRWLVEPTLRRQLVAEALSGPRGTIKRLSSEYGIDFHYLAAAVRRVRQRQSSQSSQVSA